MYIYTLYNIYSSTMTAIYQLSVKMDDGGHVCAVHWSGGLLTDPVDNDPLWFRRVCPWDATASKDSLLATRVRSVCPSRVSHHS